MKYLTTLLIGALACSNLAAQHCIVRQSGGESFFRYHDGTNAYTTLVQVISEAVDGDTIHLPGATYDITTELVIAEQLVFVGTGVDPDSTGITGQTRWLVDEELTITNTADSVEFHGVHFVYDGGFIRFGTNPASSGVDGAKFFRCIIEPIIRLEGGNTGTSLATNTLFDGCIFAGGQIQVRDANPTMIRNSIFFEEDLSNAGVGTRIENCIVLDVEQNLGQGNNDVQYANCIFLHNGAGMYSPSEQSTFENNLWVLPPGGDLDLSNVLNASGNEHTSLISNVFQLPLPSFTGFDWAYNYHLVPGSPYETMGLGGTQVGIYGGGALSAWKDGALPFNPHWDQFYAPGATNGGVLQGVQLRGTAQTH